MFKLTLPESSITHPALDRLFCSVWGFHDVYKRFWYEVEGLPGHLLLCQRHRTYDGTSLTFMTPGGYQLVHSPATPFSTLSCQHIFITAAARLKEDLATFGASPFGRAVHAEVYAKLAQATSFGTLGQTEPQPDVGHVYRMYGSQYIHAAKYGDDTVRAGVRLTDQYGTRVEQLSGTLEDVAGAARNRLTLNDDAETGLCEAAAMTYALAGSALVTTTRAHEKAE